MMRKLPAAHLLSISRMAAGPLAFVAFLLPWLHGPGALAGESYSGLDLVRLTGILQGIDLPLAQSVTLMGARVALIALPVAAAWVTLLAPFHRWHWGYPVAAAYLVAFAAFVAAIGFLRAGNALPQPGPALLAASSAMLLAPRLHRPRVRLAGIRLSRRQAIPQM